MEQMISKEESDGKRKKLCTVHTQTDFGPYFAFPPQGGNAGPSDPSTPEQERSSLIDTKLNYLQDASYFARKTDTVDERRPENTGIHKLNGVNGINGITSKRISLHSKEFAYYAHLSSERVCGIEEIPQLIIIVTK